MRALALLLAAFFLSLPGSAARAQSCTFTIGDVDFGAVDVLSGGQVSLGTSLHISCSGLSLNTVRVCASIGSGSGGAVSGARRLLGSNGTLDYQLYSSGSTVWGSNYWGLPGAPPTIDVPLNLGGSGSTSVPITVTLFGAQQTAHVGAYQSNFTASDNRFVYGYTFLGIVGCHLIPLLPQLGSTTFKVQAHIDNTCHVTAQDIDFGTRGILSSNVDATGEVSVRCTNGTPYSVGLNGGLAAAPPTARHMTGPATILYGIYRDAARTQAWGSTVGTTMAGNGSGLSQPLTTYGRVPPQAAAPGTYTDSVIATVTY
jgi:spore coat protein U-like protein